MQMTTDLIISIAIFGIGMVVVTYWALMGPKAVAKLIVMTIGSYTAALALVLFGVLVATFLERVFQ